MTLAEKIKTQAPLDDMALLAQVQGGVDPEVISLFREHAGFSKEVMASLLHMAPKTIDNLKNQKRKVEKLQAELLLNLIRLFNRGESVFGGVHEFKDWLSYPQPALDMHVPNQLLSSVTGIRLVEECLLRIEHGYAA